MHFFVTGHTGFKGSWLVLMLKELGHEVSGLALNPEPNSLFERAHLSSLLLNDFRTDIRNFNETEKALVRTAPDVVIHLAAQPLVRHSYKEPRFTYETNVLGTLNVLESVSKINSVKAQVVITTDKVYKNVNRVEGYREDEPLGGDDPYSSSKSMADILTQAWVKSFPGTPTAIARAGNVIGGGDVSKDRLFVDLMNNFQNNKPTHIRYPEAVRPWQHVLDCNNGYLALTNALLNGEGLGEWNFGPGRESFVTVSEVATKASELWANSPGWIDDSDSNHLYEAELLALNSSKAESLLGWRNKLSLDVTIDWTISWNTRVISGVNAREATTDQIKAFNLIT